MLFKSKLKWVALFVLGMSTASLVVHLSITKFSDMGLVQYSPISGFRQDFASLIGTQGRWNKKLWGPIKSLESLQPYANPRNNYPAPTEKGNGFIYAKVFGGFAKIRSSICDLVTISRLLNATLVIPEIQESLRSKGISYKFKSFSYLYDEEQFIASLTNDVIIVKSLPENLKASRKRKEFPNFKPKSSASPDYYIKEILPQLQKAKVIGLILTDGGCLQSILPPIMSELQRLRCRVAFHALQFRPGIQILGQRMLERLRSWGHPILAYHPGLVRDTLAYHGCAELFQDVHTELIQHRRAQMIKQGILKEKLSMDSHLRRDNGSCPLMPEEVGVLLRAMGYPPKTIVYLAGSETFGSQRVLIPLRGMFPNLVDRTSLCSKKELSDLIGPETSLPLDLFQPPPSKNAKQLKEEWNKAGPRPRPLPPPPDRPIYRHEKEGWYGWITETDKEPNPSAMDLRMQAHRLLWDALDYIISVEADAFFPGFHNDGKWPDFAGLVMGQRLYESASSRTYRPDRKVVAKLFNITRENLYHPKHNWTLSVKEHLNKSLGEEGLIRQSLLSKSMLFLSHPLPECSCRISSVKVPYQVKGNGGRSLYGGEDECPKWIQHGQEAASLDARGNNDNSESSDYEETTELSESDDNDGKNTATLPFDRDEEWDPND
ncbi:protein EMBRYO SAC DEVELOPMENT ARREST 30-like [Mangifera indica]|uniref:protein EMBRYO SAC DEVELOPMENT ARREST 30-like n=1 Tax=Mangifera indica TaxID=29780 RepID=UPI001CFA07AE|nr:protein EMBRYO SAC DEVELOPMENT ARREST 30-like [Mangifera indica]XP_044500650.1 protein EMBRYO SAC DEVELOPMENT ARREST 30-like [Mangifera indica]